jgi:hypothetical protein
MNARAQGMRLALAVAGLLAALGCDPDWSYPDFQPRSQRLWCGEQLCEWSVIEGQAAKTTSWHDRDPGVRLSGARASLSRLTRVDAPEAGAQPPCLWFQLEAHTDEGTSLRLQVDLGDDGSVEHGEVLKNGDNVASGFVDHGPPWGPRHIPAVGPSGAPARVVLSKEGPADAYLFPSYIAFAPCPSRTIDAGSQ